jgi:hypothetical protein
MSPSSQRDGRCHTGWAAGGGGSGGGDGGGGGGSLHGGGQEMPTQRSWVSDKQYTGAAGGICLHSAGKTGPAFRWAASKVKLVQLALADPLQWELLRSGQGHHEPGSPCVGRPHAVQEFR